jgi:solute carrier family 36 (proton-coupled amino acid transporter)
LVKNELIRELGERAAASFGQIGYSVFGRRGEVAVQIVLTFTQCGFSCAYVIFIATSLHALIPELTYLEWAAVTFVPFLLISMPREFKFLAPVSIVGYVAELLAVGYVVYFGYAKRSVADDIAWDHITKVDTATLPIFFGIAVYTFEGIGLVVDMEKAMKHPEHFEKLLWLSYVILVTMFVVVGVTGYLAFGEETHSVIVLNLPQHTWFTKAIMILLMISLYASFPVMLFPVFSLLDNIFFSAHTRMLEPKRTALRTVVVALVVAVAVSIPHFGLFMSLIGGLGSSSLCFLFPTLCYLAYFWKRRDEKAYWSLQVVVCVLIILFGVFAACISTAATVRSLVELYEDK